MQCDYFDAGRCRSCTLMGTPYAGQLAAKQHRAATTLALVAPGIRWLDPVSSPQAALPEQGQAGRRGPHR